MSRGRNGWYPCTRDPRLRAMSKAGVSDTRASHPRHQEMTLLGEPIAPLNRCRSPSPRECRIAPSPDYSVPDHALQAPPAKQKKRLILHAATRCMLDTYGLARSEHSRKKHDERRN